MAKGRGGALEQPGSIVPQLMQKLGLAKQYRTEQLFYNWERIVGEGIARHARPVRLDFHTLFLKADSPVWANQLLFMQEELLQRINGYAAEHLVKEIRFAQEPWWKKPRQAARQEKPADKEKNQLLPSPTKEEKRRALEMCLKVEDAPLQELLQRTTEHILARCRVHREQGWHQCPSCGRLCPKEEEHCQACRMAEKNDLRRRLRHYLEVKPWAPYSEIYEQFACPPELLREVRVNLLQLWCSRLAYTAEDCSGPLAKKLVMLYTARRPEDVSPELQEKILKKLKFDLRPAPRQRSDRDEKQRAEDSKARK